MDAAGREAEATYALLEQSELGGSQVTGTPHILGSQRRVAGYASRALQPACATDPASQARADGRRSGTRPKIGPGRGPDPHEQVDTVQQGARDPGPVALYLGRPTDALVSSLPTGAPLRCLFAMSP